MIFLLIDCAQLLHLMYQSTIYITVYSFLCNSNPPIQKYAILERQKCEVIKHNSMILLQVVERHATLRARTSPSKKYQIQSASTAYAR